ncbi:MAG: hypothetical protein RJA07_1366 [Bacteroidota bacterium]|jgi:four helix bundle protein
MHKFKDLKVWQEGVELTVLVHNTVNGFPKEELFSLTQQIKRSVISIPSNIAEGAGRNGKKEFVNFLGIANGSSFELQTQLIIANKLKFILDDDLAIMESKIDYIQKMIYNLQKTLA